MLNPVRRLYGHYLIMAKNSDIMEVEVILTDKKGEKMKVDLTKDFQKLLLGMLNNTFKGGIPIVNN